MTMPFRPWDAPEITGWRRLPMHTLRHREGDVGVHRLELDGDWRFELFGTPEQALAATGSPRAQLAVPGCWTVQTFDDVNGVGDLPHYTNVQMPWPDLPPHPPERNPTGVYERDVDIPADWAGRRVVLHVGAAESVLIVHVDGVPVGVGKDSHLAGEFDLSDVVTPGHRHTVRLVVVKWSDATFIEDQDQWWHGGVTRSVFLYSTGWSYLADVGVLADLAPDGAGRLSVDVEVATGPGAVPEVGWTVQARVEGLQAPLRAGVPVAGPVDSSPPDETDAAGLTEGRRAMDLVYRRAAGLPMEPAHAAIAEQVHRVRRGPGMGRLRVTADLPGVTPWSPETPRLYRLTVTLHDPDGQPVESTEYRIGFRNIRIVGNDLLVNGLRLLFRGVNRHDFDPLRGRTVAAEEIREDLLLMKRFGFNAVRTSHYPNDPVLLDQADELGLLVIDEADIECHAFAHHLPADPAYLSAFVDRVSRMVRRDRNHASVVIWSLGNESGYGPNHDAAAGWVRGFDPSRPLHYEGAVMFDWTGPQTASDLTCPMYPPIDTIVGHARSGRQLHPLIMCEYSHAMGNSNGTLAEYWQAIESTPGLQGGFIWEFRDHGILQRLSDGRPAGIAASAELAATEGTGVAPSGYRWAYGGDFGDRPHDGTFVTDGLVFPDRAPKPALWEHRQLAAPVRLSPGQRWGEVVIENHQQVRDLSWLRGQWQVLADGAVRRPAVALTAPAALPTLRPGGRAVVQLPPELLADLAPRPGVPAGEGWLTLRLISAVDEPWAPAGSALPSAQLLLRTEGRALPLRVGAGDGGPGSTPLAPVQLDGDGWLVHPALAAPPRLSLWRAPTDNDRIGGMAARWEGLRSLTRTVLGVHREGARTTVRAGYLTGQGIQVEHVQTFTPLALDGGRTGLLVEEVATIPAQLLDLPRVGTVFELAPGPGWVDWFGAGPGETYPDRRAAGEIGGYGMAAADWFTPYLRPQESGGRHGVRWFSVSDGGPNATGGYDGTRSVSVHLDQPRQVSLAHYRAEDLDAATHHDQLIPRPELVVQLDAAHRGVGTASCGPDTLPAYQLAPGVHRWSWLLTTTP